MRWLYDLEDVDELWAPVGSVAAAGGFFIAREDNLGEVNAILEKQGPLLLSLKEKIRTE